MVPRTMPPARDTPVSPACGGAQWHVAWAITNNMASTRDLYVEQVDPSNPASLPRWRYLAEFAERHVEH